MAGNNELSEEDLKYIEAVCREFEAGIGEETITIESRLDAAPIHLKNALLDRLLRLELRLLNPAHCNIEEIKRRFQGCEQVINPILQEFLKRDSPDTTRDDASSPTASPSDSSDSPHLDSSFSVEPENDAPAEDKSAG